MWANMAVAEKKAMLALKEIDPSAQIGPVCAIQIVYPQTSNPKDVQAAYDAEEMMTYSLLDMSVFGKYPPKFYRLSKIPRSLSIHQQRRRKDSWQHQTGLPWHQLLLPALRPCVYRHHRSKQDSSILAQYAHLKFGEKRALAKKRMDEQRHGSNRSLFRCAQAV